MLDTGYPPPAQVVPHQEIARQVPVAWLVRIEVEAQRLLAEAESLPDWLARVDAASEAGLDAGAAGLKSIIAYRTGLGVAPVDMAAAHAAFGHAAAAARAGEEVRLAAKPLNDLLVLRALDVCRRRDVSLQLHAGYGDRDIDLRLGTPFAFRWALESGAADGVEVVFLHASWPHIRDAAVMAAIHHHVYVDIASCIPPVGHAGLVECWREALTIAPITRIHASPMRRGVRARHDRGTEGPADARDRARRAGRQRRAVGGGGRARRRADPGRELAEVVRAAVIRTYGPGRRDCRYDVVELDSLDAWPHALFPSHLLLCLDATRIRDRQLSDRRTACCWAACTRCSVTGRTASASRRFAERESVLDGDGRLTGTWTPSIDVILRTMASGSPTAVLVCDVPAASTLPDSHGAHGRAGRRAGPGPRPAPLAAGLLRAAAGLTAGAPVIRPGRPRPRQAMPRIRRFERPGPETTADEDGIAHGGQAPRAPARGLRCASDPTGP